MDVYKTQKTSVPDRDIHLFLFPPVRYCHSFWKTQNRERGTELLLTCSLISNVKMWVMDVKWLPLGKSIYTHSVFPYSWSQMSRLWNFPVANSQNSQMSEKSCGSEVECLPVLQDTIHSITNTEPTTHQKEERKERRRGAQGGRGRERGKGREEMEGGNKEEFKFFKILTASVFSSAQWDFSIIYCALN